MSKPSVPVAAPKICGACRKEYDYKGKFAVVGLTVIGPAEVCEHELSSRGSAYCDLCAVTLNRCYLCGASNPQFAPEDAVPLTMFPERTRLCKACSKRNGVLFAEDVRLFKPNSCPFCGEALF